MNELDLIKEAYLRIQSLSDNKKDDFNSFLRDSVCSRLFESPCFWNYIRPILYWYSDRFETEEFSSLFNKYLDYINKIVCEPESIKISEEQLKKIQNNISYPFKNLLENGEFCNIQTKDHIKNILRGIKTKDFYFQTFDPDGFTKKKEWIYALPEINKLLLLLTDKKTTKPLREIYLLLEEFFRHPKGQTQYRYLRLLKDYYLRRDLKNPFSWCSKDPKKEKLICYFIPLPDDYHDFQQKESILSSWESVLQDLEFAVEDGKIKDLEEKSIEGKIFIASYLKLQYEGKTFHEMYQGKVPSVACRLVQKHNGKFALDEIVNGANTRTEKKAEENLRDFQDNIKKKLGMKGDVSIISIVSEENGKMVIFNPDFWVWRQNS